MHMQDGVGRQGYRVLAWVCAGIGVVGLGAGWYAFAQGLHPFQWLGFGFAGAALAGLVAIIMTVLARAVASQDAPAATPSAASTNATPAAPTAARNPPATRTHTSTVETPAQRLPPPQRMVRLGPVVERKKPAPAVTATAKEDDKPLEGEVGIEFKDAEPAAKAAPTGLVMPPAFEDGPDSPPGPVPWPERRAPSGVTLGEMQNRAAQQLSVTPPVVMARIWYPQSGMPRGWQKGQCGDCGTALMAPPQRPLRLRCPHCDKVTDLS